MNAGHDQNDAGGERDWLFDGEGEPIGVEREAVESLRAARWAGDVEGMVARIRDDAPSSDVAGSATLSDGESRGTATALRGLGARVSGRKGTWRPALLAAAGLVLVVGVWGVLVGGSGSAWERASGSAWQIGGWIETGAGEEVLVASDIGRVTVGPGSRVRLVSAGADEHRLELEEGSIEAFIYAPPRLFFVDLPGATAVDMGCAYELDVAADGSGILRVTGGWVELEDRAEDGAAGVGLVSRVPAGAVCHLGVDGVPGLPWFEDAGEAFGELVEGVESGEAGALDALLGAARARDGLTLWHLVARTAGEQRGRVVAGLAELVPLADATVIAGVESEDVTVSDEAMQAWWYEVRQAW